MITQELRPRSVNGYQVSGNMQRALAHLKAAKDGGYPFTDLPAHPRTIQALLKLDWVFVSHGVDGTTKYKITSRGEKALAKCLKPARRNDGLCPVCGINPKYFHPGGRAAGYCAECLKNRDRRRWHLRGKYQRAGKLCSGCHNAPRRVYPSGKASAYCLDCDRDRKRKAKADKAARVRERIASGDIPLCEKCRSAPIHYTEKTCYGMCFDCQSAYMAAYNDKRRPKSKAARRRKPSKSVVS